MKTILTLLTPGRIAALLVCCLLSVLAYVLKFVLWGYSFSALVCVCLIAVILFYTFMPLIGLEHPAFARISIRIFTIILCIGLLVVGITECLIIRASFGKGPAEFAAKGAVGAGDHCHLAGQIGVQYVLFHVFSLLFYRLK